MNLWIDVKSWFVNPLFLSNLLLCQLLLNISDTFCTWMPNHQNPNGILVSGNLRIPQAKNKKLCILKKPYFEEQLIIQKTRVLVGFLLPWNSETGSLRAFGHSCFRNSAFISKTTEWTVYIRYYINSASRLMILRIFLLNWRKRLLPILIPPLPQLSWEMY